MPIDSSTDISVLLPFRFPDLKLFRVALKSVLAQTDVSLELVLVDNGSNDDIKGIISEFRSNYSNIVLQTESRTGISYALNTGLEFCTSKYIARMDADDEMIPSRLFDQLNLLKGSDDIQVVSGLVKLKSSVSDHRGIEYYINDINEIMSPQEIYHHRFIESPVVHPSVMFEKSLIEQYGSYTTEDQVPEDYELWLRWLSNGIKFQKIDQQVLVWNDSPDRLTRSHDNYSRSAFDTIRLRYLIEFLKRKKDDKRNLMIWGAGKLAKQKIKTLEENGIQVDGIIDVDVNKSVGNKQVYHYSAIPSLKNTFIISMVSNRGIYKEIKEHLINLNFVEGSDFLLIG